MQDMNPLTPCLVDNKCTKKYFRELYETHNRGEGYSKYRHRKPEKGGHTATIKTRNGKIEIDNR